MAQTKETRNSRKVETLSLAFKMMPEVKVLTDALEHARIIAITTAAVDLGRLHHKNWRATQTVAVAQVGNIARGVPAKKHHLHSDSLSQ